MTASPREIWVFCRAQKADLCYLRYTLEAYEGLCLPTTLSGGEGRVKLHTSAGLRSEMEATLAALAQEIPLEVERWEDRVPAEERRGNHAATR